MPGVDQTVPYMRNTPIYTPRPTDSQQDYSTRVAQDALRIQRSALTETLRRERTPNTHATLSRFSFASLRSSRSTARIHAVSTTTHTPIFHEQEAEVEHEIFCRFIDGLLDDEVCAGDVVPVDLLCPITRLSIRHPVLLLADGMTYERHAINKWLALSRTSPISRTNVDVLPGKSAFFPNHAFRGLTQQFAKDYAKRIVPKKLHDCIKFE